MTQYETPSPQPSGSSDRKLCDFPDCECSSGAAERCGHPPAPQNNMAGLEAQLDAVWNAAVEQAAVIANDCVHLTPDPGAAIRVMLDGRTKIHQPATQAPETRAVGDDTPSGDNIPCAVCGRETQAGGRHDFSSLFPSKTPEEIDQDPVYRKVHAEMTSLRAALQEKEEGE